MDYNGGRQDQVEQWYATIKRKPKESKLPANPENMETDFDPQTDYEADCETNDKAKSSEVHWKFDNKPLVARSHKK